MYIQKNKHTRYVYIDPQASLMSGIESRLFNGPIEMMSFLNTGSKEFSVSWLLKLVKLQTAWPKCPPKTEAFWEGQKVTASLLDLEISFRYAMVNHSKIFQELPMVRKCLETEEPVKFRSVGVSVGQSSGKLTTSQISGGLVSPSRDLETSGNELRISGWCPIFKYA